MSILMGLKPGTVEKLKHTLLYLRLTPKMRNQVMQKVLWRLKKNAKKNVSHQQSPEGKTWTPRKKKLKGGVRKNKLLKESAANLNSRLEQQGERGKLFYENLNQQRPARLHNSLKMPVEQTEKDKKALKKLLAQNHKPATPKTSTSLRELGYQVRNGKTKTGKQKYKKVRLKSIQQTMSRGQAGLIIRMMEKRRNKQAQGFVSYKMPKREFLDENPKRNADIITKNY